MNDTIKTLIVDDEPEARKLLVTLLKKYEWIHVAGQASNIKEAKEVILKTSPELVLLDVEMPQGNGFELLEQLEEVEVKPKVIFTTAYDKYAIQAIKKSAIDYLLKPINPAELEKSLNKYRSEQSQSSITESLSKLIQDKEDHNRIRINTRSGFLLLDPDEILFCEADSNYTIIQLKYDKKEVTTLNLGKIEELLKGDHFKRIGRSYIINSNYLYRVDRKQKKCFMEFNGTQHSVSIPDNFKWDI